MRKRLLIVNVIGCLALSFGAAILSGCNDNNAGTGSETTTEAPSEDEADDYVNADDYTEHDTTVSVTEVPSADTTATDQDTDDTTEVTTEGTEDVNEGIATLSDYLNSDIPRIFYMEKDVPTAGNYPEYIYIFYEETVSCYRYTANSIPYGKLATMKDADIRTAVLMDVMAENVDVIYENSPYELILMEDEESGMADEYIIADKQCDEDGNYVSSDERLKYLSMLFIEQEVDGVVYAGIIRERGDEKLDNLWYRPGDVEFVILDDESQNGVEKNPKWYVEQ